MIPQHLTVLDAMPQTNNGKIDYKALPAPQESVTSTSTDAQPRTPAEKLVIEVWQNVLDTDDVGVHDNFFDLGGHSLLVMKVITEVETRTGVKLSPRDFLIGTAGQMAEQLEDVCPANTSEARRLADATIEQSTVEQTESVVSEAVVETSSSEVSVEAKAEETTIGKAKRLLKFWD